MICPGCLKEMPIDAYCSRCIKHLWNGNNNIKPVLTFNSKDFVRIQREYSGKMSISGVQDKISLAIIDNSLTPVDIDGKYILKPVPSITLPQFIHDVPANEHITMQIAKQLFKMQTAECGLVYFADGEPAYITRRFDWEGSQKIHQEDFCQLSNRTAASFGDNYKYSGSYQEAGEILKQFCSAWQIEAEKLFSLITFNYVFANGDAHLKNFSLIETRYGDYMLSPAYDLLATSIHIPNESRTALDMFREYESDSFRANGFYKRDDFLHLSALMGIKEKRGLRILNSFSENKEKVIIMIKRSLLSDSAKDRYITVFSDRLVAVKD